MIALNKHYAVFIPSQPKKPLMEFWDLRCASHYQDEGYARSIFDRKGDQKVQGGVIAPNYSEWRNIIKKS
ncbi:MAG: hypothetical protein ACJAS1_000530 [Oleiphilaceae bacterium]|jgi:hypothetical protein